MRIELLVNNTYINGQTDGMKLYKIEDKNDWYYVFAANKTDAKSKYKANLTVPLNSVRQYISNIY